MSPNAWRSKSITFCVRNAWKKFGFGKRYSRLPRRWRGGARCETLCLDRGGRRRRGITVLGVTGIIRVGRHSEPTAPFARMNPADSQDSDKLVQVEAPGTMLRYCAV